MTTTRERIESFEVSDGHLVRKVVPHRGNPYEHRCPMASFEQVAHATEELGEQGFTLESLLEYERNAGRDVTFTNVAVAIAFWKERGLLDVRRRRNYVDDGFFFEDAMIEFHALAENG